MTRSTLKKLRDGEQQSAVGREIINLFLRKEDLQHPFQNGAEADPNFRLQEDRRRPLIGR